MWIYLLASSVLSVPDICPWPFSQRVEKWYTLGGHHSATRLPQQKDNPRVLLEFTVPPKKKTPTQLRHFERKNRPISKKAGFEECLTGNLSFSVLPTLWPSFCSHSWKWKVMMANKMVDFGPLAPLVPFWKDSYSGPDTDTKKDANHVTQAFWNSQSLFKSLEGRVKQAAELLLPRLVKQRPITNLQWLEAPSKSEKKRAEKRAEDQVSFPGSAFQQRNRFFSWQKINLGECFLLHSLHRQNLGSNSWLVKCENRRVEHKEERWKIGNKRTKRFSQWRSHIIFLFVFAQRGFLCDRHDFWLELFTPAVNPHSVCGAWIQIIALYSQPKVLSAAAPNMSILVWLIFLAPVSKRNNKKEKQIEASLPSVSSQPAKNASRFQRHFATEDFCFPRPFRAALASAAVSLHLVSFISSIKIPTEDEQLSNKNWQTSFNQTKHL